ncbi:inositol monophosphatase family protein [Acidomonas methanolica]|uniref:inositol monophosphatase family protein n=1 Tax=Acidomonas methanolica TaxID=437 RepID=UPI00211A2DEE|nr:inositol monophosphatase family protein [Acidomonas methanolica]MCQ9154512.1 inositol monophosphatase family protein [Acidomonas methanolica]
MPLPPDALATARACADVARAAVLPHFRRGVTVDDKSDESPVTLADRSAEQAIRDILSTRHPRHGVLGEEFGRSGMTEGEWCWVVDPIDGTRSFITGRPSFTTLIALLHEGRPVLGVIDQPVTGERWIGVEGEATRYETGCLPLPAPVVRTRPCPDLAEAELSCTSPDMLAPPSDRRFSGLKHAARRTSWGGDAYAYGLLALGQIDLIAECSMKPWDWAALVPVITGAGGVITDWAGDPLRLDSDGTVLACGDPAMLHAAVRALSPTETIG